MRMTEPPLNIENLALQMHDCIWRNDMVALLGFLQHPRAAEAVQWETASCLRGACVRGKLDFIPILLPYACDDDVGVALAIALAEGQHAAFQLIAECNPHSLNDIHESALGWVGGHYTRSLSDMSSEGQDKTKQYLMCLQYFFDYIPRAVVEWQLGHMALNAHESQPQMDSFSMVQQLWSARDKDILEHEISSFAHRISVRRI